MPCPSDDTLVAMLEHALPPAALADLEQHMDSCDSCRRVLAAAATRSHDGPHLAEGTHAPDITHDAPVITDAHELSTRTIAARYAVVAPIGKGGMGTVYLARDLTLGREVALKLHRVGSGSDRLHREAVAMAKLAHPNVVTVFEVTSVDDRLCVAMEYVRGKTLRDWLKAQPRTWREILAMLAGAGAGLAAAHDAGLVHRDFKPENVLVGDDGRPRVGDFGLARVGAGVDTPPELKRVVRTLTQTGTVVGTPAYMAPEQLSGEIVDARADQFAFSVVVWECVYRARPYPGKTMEQLLGAIQKGILPTHERSDVPPRVRAVLARGLAKNPRDRFPDMHALLAALATAARPRTRRTIAIAAVGVAVVATGTVLGVRAINEHRREAACASDGDAIRARVDAEAIRRAFGPRAAKSAERVIGVLDRAAGALAAQAVETCRGRDEPDRMTAARRACIAVRDGELAAVVDLLAHADAAAIQRAADAAWALYDPSPCDDAHALLAMPTVAAPHALDLVERLGRVRALHDAGTYREAATLAQALVADARTRGDRGLQLAALHQLAQLREQVDTPASALATYEEMLSLAEKEGRDLDAASALEGLAHVAGIQSKDHVAARKWIGLAQAKLERLGGGNPALRGAVLLTDAQVLSDDDKLLDAEHVMQDAIAALEQAFGADHPNVGKALGTLTQIQLNRGEVATAWRTIDRARGILAAALGDDHPTVAGADLTAAQVLIAQKNYATARERLLRADAVFVRAFGEGHPIRAAIYGNLDEIEAAQGHWPEAIAAALVALAIVDRAQGADSPNAAGVHVDLARIRAASGDLDGGRAEAERAIAIYEKLGANMSARLAIALDALADIELEHGHPERALPLAERALAIGGSPDELASEKLAVARALRAGKRDPERAKKLADEARAGATDPDTQSKIEAFLAAR